MIEENKKLISEIIVSDINNPILESVIQSHIKAYHILNKPFNLLDIITPLQENYNKKNIKKEELTKVLNYIANNIII